ncbi:MAG TPA: ribokinase [Alphaproteobacteria bacterium]
MILVFGSINIDLVATVPSIPRPGETVLSARYETTAGGKGANQAVAAARARADARLPVVMAGAVGDDGFGAFALANLAKNGVDTRAVRKGGEPTGCAFIAVNPRGENAITVASGANRTVRAADVPDAMLGQARAVVLQMEIPVDENIALARRARAAGTPVILNLAPAPADLSPALLERLLASVDVLVLNELEAAAVAAAYDGVTGTDPGTMARDIAERAKLTAVITLGADGAVASVHGKPPLAARALTITPVDTTGAGDAFVGIMAAKIAEGVAFERCLRYAAVGASLACLALGAQASLPYAADIEKALAESPT